MGDAPSRKNIALCMIVKDEAEHIRRALTSARPFIDSWVIVDTGSTDNTEAIIVETMKEFGIPGVIAKMKWKNFAHNRSAALQICKENVNPKWALILDADDTLEGDPVPQEVWDRRDVDGYMVDVYHNMVHHLRTHILNMDSNWLYIGEVHEFPACSATVLPNFLSDEEYGMTIDIKQSLIVKFPGKFNYTARTEGCRSHDPNKYLNDARLLTDIVKRNPNGPLMTRNTFYLAQSLRDAGLVEAARPVYKRRAKMDGTWVQERYVSYINLITNESPEKALKHAIAAFELLPKRLEAPTLILAARREHKLPTNHLVLSMAVLASALNPQREISPGTLFAQLDTYTHVFDIELSLAALDAGDTHEYFDIAKTCFDRLIARPGVPEHIASQSRKNLELLNVKREELVAALASQEIVYRMEL